MIQLLVLPDYTLNINSLLGYVQGMNFIASSILYHAEEYLAFWLMAMIFEMFEMRDIYLPSKIQYSIELNIF